MLKKDYVRFEYILPNSVWFVLSFVFLLSFGNKWRNTNFKLYWNSLIFFNYGICCQIKICPVFFVLFVVFGITIEVIWVKKVYGFKIHWNTSLKILYLKDYKWLLSQNQQVRNNFFGYRWYEALAKHIKHSQPAITCSKLTIETLEQGVKYVQS